EIARCAKCGKCRSVCPTFVVARDETRVARGRISLLEGILAGNSVPTRYAREILASCYGCTRCMDACPSGVRVDFIIQQAKFMLAQERGVKRFARFFFRRILPRRRVYDRVVRLASVLQRLLPGHAARPIRHLPLLYKGRRSIPHLARRPALRALPELVKGRGEMKVSLFTGCLLNYVYPEVIASIIKILEAHGVDIIMPRTQLCCGAPVLAQGDREAATVLARRNIACLEPDKVDAVVFGCASCGLTVKRDYPMLLPEGGALAAKVYDITEFIQRFLGYSNIPLDETVTYHDPCHLRWGRGVAEPPRELLRQSCRFVEMAAAGECCGLGGSFSISHYDVSCALGDRKVRAIRESGAGSVATACPGCMLQLQDQLARHGMDTAVLHVAQIYERSYFMERPPDKNGNIR
ncbi:MAG: (Fe-S)-binding protein, partial [Candidatus Aureabacteria bacterium]|nr:(Fe-S)-binding protein [Candidatus Auribacterota bacterium]